ncbi:MAG: TIGR03749 family integrating conjugative element protein, partial [Saezia sp.]
PLAVPLLVGQERVIFVDRNVRVGVPGSLSGKLRVQSTGGSVYLMALEPIAPTRIQLQDAESGTLILMDIAATQPDANDKPLEPIQIVEGVSKPVRYGQLQQRQTTASQSTTSNVTANSRDDAAAASQMRETPIPVILTRYAAQNLNAPLRTVEPVAGISRVNIRGDLDLKTLLPMLPVTARVMAAWRLDDYFVTAVALKNTSHQVINLDPRLLQGNFIAATFQHFNLGSAGDSTDTTVVYMVTKKHGLAGSILPALSQINAQSNRVGGSDEK